jgi:hypothetical protein
MKYPVHQEDNRLDGWKEISSYLKRDVRTCQRWEKENGLPIYRINDESERSKIYSYKSELDIWFKSKKTVSIENNKALSRKILRGSIAVISICILAGIIFFFFSQKGQSLIRQIFNSVNPVSMKVRGTNLAFFDVKDNFLWSVEIGNHAYLEDYYYDITKDWPKYSELGEYRRNRYDFSDIDKDGKNEVVCVLMHENTAERCIAFYNNMGIRQWSHTHKSDQKYEEGKLGNNYKVMQLNFNDIDDDGIDEILVLWSHIKRFPSVFLIYDAEGNEILKYLHTGVLQFFRVAKINEDQKFIFLGGTNNILDGDAVLSVLDCSHLKSGLAPPYKIPEELSHLEKLRKYIPIDPVPAHQICYMRFRRNVICKLKSIFWLNMIDVKAGENGIFLSVNYARNKLSPVHYLFDQDFRLRDIRPGGEFIRDYADLLKSGEITIPLEQFLKSCDKDILQWSSQGWTAISY